MLPTFREWAFDKKARERERERPKVSMQKTAALPLIPKFHKLCFPASDASYARISILTVLALAFLTERADKRQEQTRETRGGSNTECVLSSAVEKERGKKKMQKPECRWWVNNNTRRRGEKLAIRKRELGIAEQSKESGKPERERGISSSQWWRRSRRGSA
jgi:hypothetical protein